MDINPADIKDETIECLDPYTYQCFEEVGEVIRQYNVQIKLLGYWPFLA